MNLRSQVKYIIESQLIRLFKYVSQCEVQKTKVKLSLLV